jgi:triacylglycerol lipase
MKPILFIHGIGGSARQYQPIIKYLKNKGIKKFYEFNYESKIGMHPIKVIAEELSKFIDKNIEEKDINIIAISQGGIIALTYLKFYLPKRKNKNLKVDRLFTICSPHSGSKWANLFSLPGIIDLRPNSKLLRELERFAFDEDLNIFSVYTPFDLMVFPGWNAKRKYGKNKIVFAPTHPSAFRWKTTKKFIYENLT